MNDDADRLADAIASAASRGEALKLVGQGSKDAYGAAVGGAMLSTLDHVGVLEHRPQELSVTVRCGTPLEELVRQLAAQRQQLPFDPPRFAGRGTVGGAVAAGLAGPCRPWRGSVRDALLGLELVNGLGERLQFGGRVMKNVAGFDVTRLCAGARGRLGLILSVTFKLLPLPAVERTLSFEMAPRRALEQLRSWARRPLPLTASAVLDDRLHVRLSGAETAVDAAAAELGGSAGDDQLWAALRDHQHDFFQGAALRPERGGLRPVAPVGASGRGAGGW